MMINKPFLGRLMGSVNARTAALAPPAPAVAATAAPALGSVGGSSANVLAGAIQPQGKQPLGIQPGETAMTSVQRMMKMMRGMN